MAERDGERLALAQQVRATLAIENELTRPQARAYVRCLQTTWQVPAIAWSNRDLARQLDDSRRLLHAAHIFRTIEGVSSTLRDRLLSSRGGDLGVAFAGGRQCPDRCADRTIVCGSLSAWRPSGHGRRTAWSGTVRVRRCTALCSVSSG